MAGWLPTPPPEPAPQGWSRVYAPDAAALVLGPPLTCAATGEPTPIADACTRDCLATCGHTPEWTETIR